ncbi:MAG: hypothetical protein WA997_18800 [Anaerolineales bacterium]
MMLHQPGNPKTAGKALTAKKVKPVATKAHSIKVMDQAGLQDLTPLQRQRLDVAVMLLVNYLVSASSGK